jgi:hypothetical protein
MEAGTSNHCVLLMMMLHESLFDKYRDVNISARKQKQIKTGAEPWQRRRATPKEEGQPPKHET